MTGVSQFVEMPASAMGHEYVETPANGYCPTVPDQKVRMRHGSVRLRGLMESREERSGSDVAAGFARQASPHSGDTWGRLVDGT